MVDQTARSRERDNAKTAVRELEDAAADLRDVREQVDDIGEDTIEAVADEYWDIINLLDRYEERATDWDDFEGYVEFREALGERVAVIPDDLPHRECFVEADATLTTDLQQVLSTDDFNHARQQLAPAREAAELHERLQDSRNQYRDARHTVRERLTNLQDQLASLKRIQRLGDADLDAPTDRLREPIRAYDEAVQEAFEAFRTETAARDVLSWLDETEAYPLIDYKSPPDRLNEYLERNTVGREPIPTLLKYTDHSRSKLDHYVDDPQEFKATVGPNRTFLRNIDAKPLTVGWPPPSANRLRWRARELVAVVGRFADEDVVALARDVRTLADREDYDRLRDAAIARVELDEEERERIRTGAVEREREDVEEALSLLEDALDEYPPLDA